MPMLREGMYLRTEDYTYEVEATYQLGYYILSALVSIDCILEPIDNMLIKFQNEVQYYRYYVDSLFYYLGLINDRFRYKESKGDNDFKQEKSNKVALNRNNYKFTESAFSILSNKRPRNIIEHLDERNVKTILENSGVGGFNVLFEDSDLEMVNSIKENRNLYPCVLDLPNHRMLFYDTQAKPNDVAQFEISILELQDELNRLRKNVNDFGRLL